MKLRWKRGLGASLAALLAVSGQSVGAAVTYTIQDLGTGWNPTGINDSGYIIGNMPGQGGASSIVTWQYGCSSNCLTNLGDFGSGVANAYGVNNVGQIVGGYRLADFSQHAFLFDSGGLTDLGTLGGQISEAYGINNLGQIVGQSYLQNGGYTAFIYQNGAMQDLGVSQVFNQSQATGINDAGLVIGVAQSQFGQWTLGMTIDSANGNALTTINPPLPNPGVFLSAVNGSGAVVGYGYGNTTEAFIYAGGQITPVAGQYVSQAFDINDQGQSVGYASNAAGNGLYLNDGQAVTMWQDLIDQNLGWSISAATGAFNINNAGQIVGVASFGGQQHAFLMTPNGPTPVDAVAATDVQLAQMAVNSYGQSTSGAVGTYTFLAGANEFTGSRASTNQIYAEAYISKGANGGRDQIVIAIRGSNPADFLDKNGTFLSGTATIAYQQSADDIASLISRLRQMPGGDKADFTLTGHSLGGALAQSLAEALGVNAVAFDAPGAKGVFDSTAQARLAGIANGNLGPLYSATNNQRNIRFLGDDVSKIGNAYDGIETIIPSDSALVAEIISLQTIIGSCYTPCHDKYFILNELLSGNAPVPGISDPFKEARLPITTILTALNGAKLFNALVNPANFWVYDPDGSGDLVELNMLDSDVELAEMFLPSFASGFEVFGYSGSGWNSIGIFDGFSAFAVPTYRNYRISNAGALQDAYGNFSVGLRFNSTGTFRGSLALVSTNSSVPEPSTWLMMIFGFGLIGQIARRKSPLVSQYLTKN